MKGKYTKKAQSVLTGAQEAALKLGNKYVGTEHILLGLTLVPESIACKALESQGITYHQVMERINEINAQNKTFFIPVDFTPRAKRIVEFSVHEAARLNSSYIGTEHILIALIREDDHVASRILDDLGVNRQHIFDSIMVMLGAAESQGQNGKGMSPQPESAEKSKMETLSAYSRNLTEMATQNKFDPIVGRDAEIERIIQILSRRTKNNPCLVGDPGVGKTAIVEGLAQKIAEGNIPEVLKDKIILSLDLSAMIAGSKYRGEFEDRMKKALEEVRTNGNIILFVDEIHTIIGAGAAEGAIDASNILKPSLARGEIQLIGATTLEEYRKHIEKDAAFERRFQPVTVDEPTEAVAISMLHALRDKYEAHHKVTIADDALEAAVKLSVRYIPDRFLPDKAIDLIDEAASSLRLRTFTAPADMQDLKKTLQDMEKEKEEAIKTEEFEKAAQIKKQQTELRATFESEKSAWEKKKESESEIVSTADVADVVSRWTGIPLQSLQEEETQRLLKLEDVLHKRVIGQNEATKSIARAIRRGRVGLKDPNRPIGSFLFLGPTGVGKTELSKALAEALFGDDNAMIRLDMSEYMEKHSVSRMVGSPPGYVGYEEGGQLTEKVRRNPYSVVLFDEIEKASPEVFNILLQVLDDGHITDGQGRKIDFKNTVIIMTSNAGARNIISPKRLGFTNQETQEESYQVMKKSVMDEVKNVFKPEFINRIDDIIVFHALDKDDIFEIAKLMTNEMAKRVQENMGITLSFTDKAIEKIVEDGYDKAFGARPLRRAIQTNIEDSFAEEYLMGLFGKGDKISVGVKTNGFAFRKVK